MLKIKWLFISYHKKETGLSYKWPVEEGANFFYSLLLHLIQNKPITLQMKTAPPLLDYGWLSSFQVNVLLYFLKNRTKTFSLIVPSSYIIIAISIGLYPSPCGIHGSLPILHFKLLFENYKANYYRFGLKHIEDRRNLNSISINLTTSTPMDSCGWAGRKT